MLSIKRVICLLFLLPVLSLATTLTGSVQGPDGAPFTGTLMLVLNQPAVLLSSGGCGGPKQVASGAIVRIPVTGGNIPGGTSVYGNDCMSPVGTFYLVKMQDSNGNIVYTTYWQVAGTSEDIGSIIPTTPNALGSYSTITQVTVPPSGNCPVNAMPEQLLTGQGGIYFCNPTTLQWATSLASSSIDGYSLGFALTSPPTISSMEDMFRVAINGCPMSIEFGGGTATGVQGIVGCTQAPNNVTYSGITSGVSGYALGGGGSANTPVAGGYFYGAPQNGNSSAIGVNGVGSNFPASGVGVGVPFIAGGYFIDNIATSGTRPVSAYGAVALLSTAVAPSSGVSNGFMAFATNVPWNIAYDSEAGGASIGMRLGPINASGLTNAQPLQMVARTSGGALLQNQFSADSNGAMNWQPGSVSGGAFNFVPQGSSAVNSPSLQYFSYSSIGTLNVAGQFEDQSGNVLSLSGTNTSGFNFYTKGGTAIAALLSNGNVAAVGCMQLAGGAGASWCQASGAPTSTPSAGSLFSRTDTGQLYTYTSGQWNAKASSGCPNILDYGGSSLGVVSNNTAWSAAVAGAGTKACIYFPGPGTYFFSSSPSWTAGASNSYITVKGDGPNVSNLQFGAGGLVFNGTHNGDAINVEGLTFITNGVGTANAISMLNTGPQNGFAASNLKNLSFHGLDGFAVTDYWNIAMNLSSWSNVNFDEINLVGASTLSGASGNGIGIALTTAGSVSGVIYNLHHVTDSYGSVGLQIGDFIQGITVQESNFTAVERGIYALPGSAYGHNDQLLISHNQFESHTAGIDIESPFRHTNVDHNYFIVPTSASGAIFNNYAETSVDTNQLINVGGSGNGIVFSTWSNDASVVKNNTTEFFVTGVWLQSTSQHTEAMGNIGTSNTNDLLNTGTGNASSVTFTGTPTGSFQVQEGYVIHQ